MLKFIINSKDLDHKTQSYPFLSDNLSTRRALSDSVEKRKPRLAGQGLRVAVNETSTREDMLLPSLPFSAINDNSHGLMGAETAMAYDVGFLRIPRSLLEDPRFRDAKPEYQHVYLVILSRAAYYSHDVNDHGKIIKIEVGEICFSIDQIKTFCGRWISTKQVERGICYFKKVDFLGQRVGHRRSILKITHPESYNMISGTTGTTNGKRPGQDRDINKERVEREEGKKETRKKKPPAVADAIVAVEKIDKIQVREQVTLSQPEIEKAKAKFGPELFEAMCDRLNSYKISSEKAYKSDYGLFVQGSWLVAAGKKVLEEAASPSSPSRALPAKPETIGDVLNDFHLGSYTYSSKFGNFELLSKLGYTVFTKSTTDLAGIRSELKRLKLSKIRE